MSFQIIVIAKDQAESLKEMVAQLQLQFCNISRLFVLDRCVDNSAQILSDMGEHFIENKNGEGFLAGRVRDLGIDSVGVRDTFFLDGDRIPVNFSVALVEKALELYDICLANREVDFRKNFTSDFIANPEFENVHNDVFSCGITIRKNMIEKIRDYQGGRLFHPAFDGKFGEEDRYLGDMVVYFKGTCGLFPKDSYLKGAFTRCDLTESFREQFFKRMDLRKLLKEKQRAQIVNAVYVPIITSQANNVRKIKLYAGLVCPRRSLDHRKLEDFFSLNGCVFVNRPEDATDIVIITCGFLERNIQESLLIIEKIPKQNARIIVGGCLPDIDLKRITDTYRVEIITTKQIEKIDALFPEFKIKFSSIEDANSLHNYHAVDSLIGLRKNYEERAFADSNNLLSLTWNSFVIRIADGCGFLCTYCTHRNAIGSYRSKPVDRCLDEFKKGVKRGHKFFRITAMETGRYGLDIKETFPSLIRKMIEVESSAKFFVEDMNPVWLVRYKNDFKSLCENGCIKSMHTPIQSGSPRVLKAMRRYDRPAILKDILGMFKDCLLSTEILVGFPGETSEDFEETLDYLIALHFKFVYICPYFENGLVRSKIIYPKCSHDVIKERVRRAIEIFSLNQIGYCVFNLP